MPPPPNPDDDFHPLPYIPCVDVDYGEYCPITELNALPRYSLVSFSEVGAEFPTEVSPCLGACA